MCDIVVSKATKAATVYVVQCRRSPAGCHDVQRRLAGDIRGQGRWTMLRAERGTIIACNRMEEGAIGGANKNRQRFACAVFDVHSLLYSICRTT